ncbi:MAG: response regulator [Victivallales bacterium]|nr:response regulator [Victivallales bacterium]
MAKFQDEQFKDNQRDDMTLECEAFRALLLGVCQNLLSILQKVDSYEELLLDELESKGCDTTYLLQEQNELRSAARLASNIMETIPFGGGPRVNLSTLLTGVLDRFRKALPAEQRVLENLTPELYVHCNVFELQETLLDMLERFSDLSGLRSKNWQVLAQYVKLSRNELGILQFSGGLNNTAAPPATETDFCVVSILPEGVTPPELRKLHPFRELLADTSAGAIPSLVCAKWLGAICNNGARLYYDAKWPNQSAILYFPVAAAHNNADDELANYSAQNGPEPQTILLVDDEDMIWDVISDMLQQLGYRIILAGDGKEAVEIYAANPGLIDLVILDMLMPNMGGRETFFLLKELDPNVKVLASSGYVSQEEIQDVMDAGAAGFLRKPYRLADLARKIHEILATKA